MKQKRKTNLSRWRRQFYTLALPVLILLSFAPALRAGFTNWDDPLYVTANHALFSSWSQSIWQLTTRDIAGEYLPLTQLSLSLDAHLWGRQAFGFHLTNLLLHIAGALLLLHILRHLLSVPNGIALTATLCFALHPLRVESVAWIAARKDVLSMLFYLSAFWWFITGYQLKRRSRQLIALLFFCLALLSKASSVTLPLAISAWLICFRDRRLRRDERLLLFLSWMIGLLWIFFSGFKALDNKMITDTALSSAWEHLPWLGSYTVSHYISKFFWPLSLSARYIVPGSDPWLGARLMSQLLLITLPLWWLRRDLTKATTRPLLLFAALWMTCSALPFMNLLRTSTPVADRYSYLPALGATLFVVAVSDGLLNKIGWKHLKVYVAAAVITILGILTYQRCHVWHDSVVLWDDMAQSAPQHPNFIYMQGLSRLQAGDCNGAIIYFERLHNETSIDLRLRAWEGRLNCLHQTNLPLALQTAQRLAKEYPQNYRANYLLGFLLLEAKRYAEAAAALEHARRLQHDEAPLFMALAAAYTGLQQWQTAEEEWLQALRLQPQQPQALYNLGNLYARRGDCTAAVEVYSGITVKTQPEFSNAQKNLQQCWKINSNP